jgi:hypothetical protein
MPWPNERYPTYANAVMTGPEHGRWLGYDTIEYDRVALGEGPELTLDRVPNGVPEAHGAGTMLVTAVVAGPGERRWQAPGFPAEPLADEPLGVARDVFRISFRHGDDGPGWLSAFFGVPYVFGSTAAQSERRVAIDCADVLVAAQRAAGDRRTRYGSVVGLVASTEAVSPPALLTPDGLQTLDGAPLVLRWGEDIEPGDLMFMDWVTAGAVMPRAWDHIGMVLGDSSADGVFDGADLVRHMSRRGLRDQPAAMSRTMRIQIRRFR